MGSTRAGTTGGEAGGASAKEDGKVRAGGCSVDAARPVGAFGGQGWAGLTAGASAGKERETKGTNENQKREQRAKGELCSEVLCGLQFHYLGQWAAHVYGTCWLHRGRCIMSRTDTINRQSSARLGYRSPQESERHRQGRVCHQLTAVKTPWAIEPSTHIAGSMARAVWTRPPRAPHIHASTFPRSRGRRING